jgi:predicted RNA-binding Zn ribbon-like protein
MQLVKWLLMETAKAASVGTARAASDSSTPRQLPILGGHLALDFANTVDDPEGAERYDHAGTYPELVGWAARIGVLRPDQAEELLAASREHPRSRSAALQRAHVLRRILNEIFSDIAALNSGQADESVRLAVPAHWAELRPFVEEALGHAELVAHGATYQMTWPITARLDATLWPIAVAAAELLTAPQLSRLKQCAGCPWVFLDQSKNRSRRWCAMNDCGTHEKIRRYVSRRAAHRAP